MEKIVVTGAAGFIGSHFINSLPADYDVMAIDNLKAGRWDRVTRNIERLEVDLNKLSDDAILDLLKNRDCLVHLAAEKHNSAINTPDLVIETNIVASERLFRLAGQAGIKSIIFSSSLYAYGLANKAKMKEDDYPIPSTLYGVSKFTGELLLEFYAEKFGFFWHAPRFFFVYGPKQFSNGGYKSMIVKNFESMKNHGKITVNGSGNQILDYIYVEDVTLALITMLKSKISTGVCNISSGLPTKINDLIDVMKILDPSSQVIQMPPDWTEGTCRVGDNSKIMRLIEWEPTTSLEEGLGKTWKSM